MIVTLQAAVSENQVPHLLDLDYACDMVRIYVNGTQRCKSATREQLAENQQLKQNAATNEYVELKTLQTQTEGEAWKGQNLTHSHLEEVLITRAQDY